MKVHIKRVRYVLFEETTKAWFIPWIELAFAQSINLSIFALIVKSLINRKITAPNRCSIILIPPDQTAEKVAESCSELLERGRGRKKEERR